MTTRAIARLVRCAFVAVVLATPALFAEDAPEDDDIESINQCTVGAFGGCTMTNMDVLTIPAAGGVDSAALIIGSLYALGS